MSNVGTMDHKCPSCDAVLKFNPHGQNWVCEFCKSSFTKEEVDAYEKSRGVENLTADTESVTLETNWDGADVYSCPNCGAQIVADENTTATFCVYCKNTAILKNKLVGAFNPTQIIPFYKTKEDALAAFKKLCRGKILMPRLFNDKKNIEDIRGIYIPFWIYDYDMNGNIKANATRVSTWVSGNYRYTKTDTYIATRSGNMHFENIPVDGSTHFANDIMNSIEPFDYRGLVPFSHSYLSGFLAEKYDVDSESASSDAIERANNSATNVLKKDIKGYTSVVVTSMDHHANLVRSDYVLLPVWLLNIKYKDQLLTFAMNGQTGKIIGDIPIDKKRAVFLWLGVFAICMVIVAIIILVLGV